MGSLAVLCNLCIALGLAAAATLTVDRNTGQYTVSLDGIVWLSSGNTVVHLNSQWYSSGSEPGLPGVLPLTKSTTEDGKGADAFGMYSFARLSWSAGGVPLYTEFRTYDDQPDLFLFEQHFPLGANSTSLGDDFAQAKEHLITGFPRFARSPGRLLDLGYFCMMDQWDLDLGGVGLQNLKGGLYQADPVLFYDRDTLQSIVLAPANNFMTGYQALPQEFGQQLACGIEGRVRSLPARFSHQTLLFASRGVNSAMMQWGDIMLKRYGKQRYDPHSFDLFRSTLGYYTDTGAVYWYHTAPGMNYEQTLGAVKAYHQQINLPVRYYELDSWWYYKEGNGTQEKGGCKLWEPRPEIFANGFAGVRKLLGTPFITHAKYFSKDNLYQQRFPFLMDAGAGIPTTQEFWDYLFAQAADYGVAIWIHDWLESLWENMLLPSTNTYSIANFHTQMGAAAARFGIQICYCMPIMGDFLQSLESGAVQAIRISDDYSTNARQWAIGRASIISWALGLAPMKDTFWSVEKHDDSPYGSFREWNPDLNVLVASLSTAGVAPGDQIGNTNAALVMKTCRRDGTLLRTSKPATAIDATWLRNGAPQGEVWHTYSDIPTDPTSALPLPPAVRFHYILASNLSSAYLFKFEDSTEPRPRPSLFSQHSDEFQPLGAIFAHAPAHVSTGANAHVAAPLSFATFEHTDSATIRKWDASTPLSLPRCSSPPAEPARSPFVFYTASPILPSNWALLGETAKFLSASPQRFTSLYVSSDGFSVMVRGSAGERVTVRAMTPAGAVVSGTCAFPGVEANAASMLNSAAEVQNFIDSNELRMRLVCRNNACLC